MFFFVQFDLQNWEMVWNLSNEGCLQPSLEAAVILWQS